MKLEFRKDYVLVVSPALVKWFGKVSTGTEDALGVAIFPFLFVKDGTDIPPWLINHERIHFHQQLQTLFVGLMILGFIERQYARFFLKLNKGERYVYAASEQEAYLNMNNPTYLESRPLWRVFYHARNKRMFRLVGPGEMEFVN